MDFVRIIPAQRFTGSPAPLHRPYTFYADAFSLHGRTIADCYRLVKGLNLPPRGYYEKEIRTPFVRNGFPTRDPESPLTKVRVSPDGKVRHEEYPEAWLEQTEFVVLGVSLADAEAELDPFPATWRALAYIVSDPSRMAYQELGWRISPAEFASARIHALFRNAHRGTERELLASRSSKEELGLSRFDRLPMREDELEYYHYLSKDSALTSEIVELFGISHRCWHGCGYLGWPGFPVCRFFLLRNRLPAVVKVLVLGGRERFVYDPSRS